MYDVTLDARLWANVTKKVRYAFHTGVPPTGKGKALLEMEEWTLFSLSQKGRPAPFGGAFHRAHRADFPTRYSYLSSIGPVSSVSARAARFSSHAV